MMQSTCPVGLMTQLKVSGRFVSKSLLRGIPAMAHAVPLASAPYVLSAEHAGPAARSLRFALLELPGWAGGTFVSAPRRNNRVVTVLWQFGPWLTA